MSKSLSSPLLLSSPVRSHYKTITPSQFLSLFLLFDDHPRRIKEICKENNVARSTIYPHFKKWKDAGRPTNADHSVFQNQRWKSRRVVDPTIEEGVAAFLRDLDANNIPFSYDIIRDLIRESHIIHLDNQQSHLRSNLNYYKEKNFKFTNPYIRRFCKEYHFKGAVLKVKKKPPKKSSDELKKEKELIKEFKEKINAAINKYGTERVINMDETPAAAIPDRVRTLVSETSKNKSITMNGEPRAVITANLSITASGDKLGTHIIANNVETVDMVENDNNGNDFFDWSGSGRMTWVNMIEYIDNVYNPYINSLPPSTLPPYEEKRINFRLSNRVRSSVVYRNENNPLPQSALVLDVYSSHIEKKHFKKHAADNHIELIYVPPGHTDSLQPLDIGINAIMKNKRIKYVKDKLREDAFTHFNKRDAVINTQRAMDEIKSSTIKNTFNIAIENAQKMSD